MKSRIMQAVVTTSVVAILAVGAIGFLHTPMGRKLPLGRKLLSWMGVQCPIDFSKLTPERVEKSRQLGVQALVGKKEAPARPALAGLNLDVTTEADAQKWAQARGIDCHSQVRGMHFLKCENVAPTKLLSEPGTTPIQALTLAFNPSGHLVAVDLFRKKLSAQEGAELMQSLSQKLQTTLGTPTEKMGELTADHLGGNIMKVSVVNYRFRDYIAMLTASNIPWSGGVVVHEQYSSAVPTKSPRL